MTIDLQYFPKWWDSLEDEIRRNVDKSTEKQISDSVWDIVEGPCFESIRIQTRVYFNECIEELNK